MSDDFHWPRVFGPDGRIWSYVEVDASAGSGEAVHQVFLVVMDRDVSVMRFRIPYVVGIKFEAHVDRGNPVLTLEMERTKVRMRAQIDSSTAKLEDLLSEVVADKLVRDQG